MYVYMRILIRFHMQLIRGYSQDPVDALRATENCTNNQERAERKRLP